MKKNTPIGVTLDARAVATLTDTTRDLHEEGIRAQALLLREDLVEMLEV
jgi:hypothetical protein